MRCVRDDPVRFLSTPSARRATMSVSTEKSAAHLFLSTPSARRATVRTRSRHLHQMYFYPRPPRGGRHQDLGGGVHSEVISIHALREEGDACPSRPAAAQWYFYPRPPRGGRLVTSVALLTSSKFLSTPSARRATWAGSSWSSGIPISIHALREEGDLPQ